MSRTALILGVANHRSIAWACVQSFLQRDYKVVFTYQNERFSYTANELIAGSFSSHHLQAIPCNVEDELPLLFSDRIAEVIGSDAKIDAVVHSIAYAAPDAMKEGSLLATSRESFLQAHNISSYSFLETVRCALPLLREGSSLTALSYLGAVRAVPNYNVMGPAKASLEAVVRGLALELPHHRVNAVSAGPINSLAARGISGFTRIRHDVEERAPLKRNVTVEEVANTIRFVASEATGMTGQTIYVDAGYSTSAGPPL
jgi:enoyl-[acyl-carrier protein] reductase I